MLITEGKKYHTEDVEVEGLRFRVAVRHGKKGKTPLLIFNGLGANWEAIFSVFEPLDEDIELISFDVPGTGSSSIPVLPYSIRGMARKARKLMEKMGYEELNILGISWGGGLAQQFAYAHPDLCKKLVLVATAPGFTMVPGRPSVLLKMATPFRYWSPRYMRRIAGSIYGGKVRTDPALIKRLVKKIRPNSWWGYILQLSAASRFTSLCWLKKIQQPTLVQTGDDDPLIPIVNGKILASKIPNSTLSIIQGGGHLFLLAQPEITLPQIETFLYNE